MRRCIRNFALFAAVLLLLSGAGFAQTISATLSGTVADATGALIPGADVTATNIDTGVATVAATNETGTYRFASLQPGQYQVSAALPGFQTQTFQLALGTAQQIRQNFRLEVGTVTTAVEVTAAPDELLTATTASVGNVLPERQVNELPLVGRSVTDLATILPGVRGTGGSSTTFAGITAGGGGNVGLELDGVNVNTGRFSHGLATNVAINPDMVEEMRIVVAAVDVEGRGSAQVRMRSRSGTNQFHGALTWNVRNSALNANSWSNNRQGIDRTWFNRHQYTATLGGPIIENRTFFFAMFDGQNGLQRQNVDALVLTDAARQGIFRFFPGVNNGHAEITPSGSGNTQTAPVVDLAGNPLNWSGIPGAAGPMQSFSVFGDDLNAGDPFRTGLDTTGFVSRLIDNMPQANAFNGGDGLNTAVHRWVRRTIAGSAGTGANADAFNRKQFHIKIDHNFDANHRLTGTWNRDYRYGDANGLSPWPNGWSGETTMDPSIMTVQLTSALSPTVLNEFRWGYRVTELQNTSSFHHDDHGEEAFAFLTKINGYPVVQRPAMFPTHMYNCASGAQCSEFGNRSPLATYTNALTWTAGVHAVKVGAELRFGGSSAWVPSGLIPVANGGEGDVPVQGVDQVPGLLAGNIGIAEEMLLFLSGSVNDTRQKFEVASPSDTEFQDFLDTYFHPDYPNRGTGLIRDWHQNEFNFFIKDDWRVTPNLTLNLGLRYDLMRVPFMLNQSGEHMTPGYLGGNTAIFGYSGRSIDAWMSGGSAQQGDLTQVVLIGEGTSYPEQGIWPSDKNNFAPAVGFAWSPDEQTAIRGGYQFAYQLPGNSLSWVDGDLGKTTPGFISQPIDFGGGTFRDFSNIVVPLPTSEAPYEAVPVTQRSQNVTLFAHDYTTPYVQTITFGVTRALSENLTVDVRYIGTRGMKLHSSLDLNAPDFRNNGLREALELTRAGGDHPMFDQMLDGLDIGSGVVGVDVTGSEALRLHPSFRGDLANGDFVSVAETLNTTNLGTIQPEGEIINGGLLRSSGLFPENFVVVNPQFGDITLRTNADSSNYHSLQTQVALRPTSGISFEATYTWSRSLGIFGDYRDVRNQRADYTLQGNHRKHDVRGYGTFELPFGPDRWLGSGTTGVLARLIEGWQVSTILRIASGAPLNVSSRNTLYDTGTPDIVAAFNREGSVAWGDTFGRFFSEEYQRVPDPGCADIASNLTRWCTNTALADASGNIVLANAAPGELGTMGLSTIEGPGSWDMDMNVQKSISIDETKQLTLRVDAQNVFNHPTPGNPTLNINSGTFGEIRSKSGSRALQAQVRFEF